MKKKLYRVKLEVSLCVLALSQFDAMEVALKTLNTDPKLQPEGVAAMVDDVSKIPKAWRDRPPGGAEPTDPRSCKDHLRDRNGG